MKRALRVKLIAFGNAEVGKSCLVKRYCEKRFVSKYLMTIGIDYGVSKSIVKDQVIKLNIFDMAGNPVFAEVRKEFYSDTNCALLVFDVSNKESFRTLDSWHEEMRNELGGQSELDKVQCILCANKCDKNRAVSELDARNWADLHGYVYKECSAFDGTGVNELFELIFNKSIESFENGGKVKKQQASSYTREEVEIVEKILSAKDNYERLGLNSYRINEDDVKKAFKKLAGMVHPDKCSAPRCEEAFKLLVQTKTSLLSRIENAK